MEEAVQALGQVGGRHEPRPQRELPPPDEAQEHLPYLQEVVRERVRRIAADAVADVGTGQHRLGGGPQPQVVLVVRQQDQPAHLGTAQRGADLESIPHRHGRAREDRAGGRQRLLAEGGVHPAAAVRLEHRTGPLGIHLDVRPAGRMTGGPADHHQPVQPVAPLRRAGHGSLHLLQARPVEGHRPVTLSSHRSAMHANRSSAAVVTWGRCAGSGACPAGREAA